MRCMYGERIMYPDLVRYMCVGACSMTVDLMVFSLLIKNHIWYQQALCISFVIGVFINFCLCSYFIFTLKGSWWRACLKHYAAQITGLMSNQIGLAFLVSICGIEHIIIARIGVQAVTFLINFTLIKAFVFSASERDSKLST